MTERARNRQRNIMRLHSIERSLWEVAKREAREAMIAAARSPKGTMTYDELTRLITAVHFEPNSLALRELAGDISFEEDMAGRGMLSAVVVHQGADELPSQHFFTLAKGLGRDTTDQERFWMSELTTVRNVWKRSEVNTRNS
jgi:hypothetical protein